MRVLRKPAILFCLLLLVGAFSKAQYTSSEYQIRSYSTKDFRASEINYSIVEDENGIIYFGNENGVLEFDGSSWKLHSLPDFSFVNTVIIGNDGNLYVGGRNEFGYMKRDSLGNLNYTSVRSQLKDTTLLKECWQIVQHKGKVYYMTYEGIVKWDGELPHLLPLENTWFLHLGKELYASVINKGIAKFENDSLQFVNEKLRFEEDNPLALLPYEGSKKLLPTEYNGIFVIDTVTWESEFWDTPISELAKDRKNRKGIWSAGVWNDSTYLFSITNDGYTWASKKGEILGKVGLKEGLLENEMTNFLKDKNGNLWIPGFGARHIIWPENVKNSRLGTVIRNISVENTTDIINSNSGSVEIEQFEPLRNLRVQYAVPGIDLADLEYSTFLEGFDREWSDWGKNPAKEYTNLEGGDYNFLVRARRLKEEQYSEASLKFMVPSPWYSNGWAKVLGGILIWFFIIGLYKLRTLQLTQKNEKLALIVQDRTLELNKANDLLASKNYELDQFVRRVSHDLVAPMRSVVALIGLSREEDDEAEKDNFLRLIESSLKKQEQFVKRMLDQAVNYRSVKNEPVQLKALLEEVLTPLTHFEGRNELAINIEVPEDFVFNSDPDRLRIVFVNLVTNAIKYRKLHASDSYLNISVRKGESRVSIEFRDNGVGIAEENISHVFEMFKRASGQAHGTGLGLFIVKEMVEKMGGEVILSSIEGEGTTFVLNFPQIELSQ